MTVAEVSSSPPRRAIQILARAALWSVLAIMALAVIVLVVLPKAIGGSALTVRTGSMAPTLAVGSIVIDRPADPSALHVGEIATYRQAGSGSLVTHRIVAVNDAHSEFTFRGDANPVADPEPVPAQAIQGKVWFDIPYAGAIRNTVGDLRPAFVIVGVASLAAYSLWQFGAAWRERKERR